MMMRSASRPNEQIPWQRELLHISALFIEVPWCILIYLAFQPGARLLPTGAVAAFVIATMFLSMELIRFMALRQVPDSISRWIVLAGIVVTMAFAIYGVFPVPETPLVIRSWSKTTPLIVPPIMVTGGFAFFLWYRGIRLATMPVTPSRASFSFRLGLLILVSLAVIPDAQFQATLVSLLPLFFMAGLISTTLARMVNLRANRDVQRTSFGRRWLGFTGAIAGIISAIGFVVSLLLAGYGIDGIARTIQGVFGVVIGVIVALMLPLLYLLSRFLELAAGFITAIFGRQTTVVFDNSIGTVAENSGGGGGPPDLTRLAGLYNALMFVCAGVIILIIVGGVFMLLRNRALSRVIEGEERESLEGEDLMDSLGNALRRRLAGLQTLLGALGKFGLSRNLINVLTIRRLYAQLIAQASQLGYARGPAETPFEYQRTLKQAFPGYPREIELVTNAYVSVHYGELPDNPEELAAVQNAVDQIMASVQDQRK